MSAVATISNAALGAELGPVQCKLENRTSRTLLHHAD